MSMDRISLCLGGFLALAALAACQGGPGAAPWSPPAGQSQAFNDGYVQGCLTGYMDAERDGTVIEQLRDEKRYATDADYRAGFEQAHTACYEEEKRRPRVIGGGNGNMG
jgi:hypothetical protein